MLLLYNVGRIYQSCQSNLYNAHCTDTNLHCQYIFGKIMEYITISKGKHLRNLI